MAAGDTVNPQIVAKLRSVRERLAVRFARPGFEPPAISAASLESLSQASKSADALASGIGKVNPRPPGFVNGLIQGWKKAVARVLDWHVRPQREFNGAVVNAIEQAIGAIESTNRNIQALAEGLHQSRDVHCATAEELDAVHKRLGEFQAQLLSQQSGFQEALAGQSVALQERFYEVVGEARVQIMDELRHVRQRIAGQAKLDGARASLPSSISPNDKAVFPAGLDYYQLERHFRGTEEEIRNRQSFYLPYFRGRKNVLDIACGRGEFLELMRDAGVSASGVDLNGDMVARCLQKSLNVTQADVFSYLQNVADGSLDGIFCSQFIEHLQPEAYIALIVTCSQKLAPGGLLAIETQNPECLAIFSQSFYPDPTHVKPIPPGLLRVLLSEAGFHKITTHFLSPASEAFPLIPPLPSNSFDASAVADWNAALQRFNETFWGGMDYCVMGYRPETARSGDLSSVETLRRIGG